MNKKVVIFGSHKWAEVVYCYLTSDSEYEVVGFTVDKDYLVTPTLFGLPVVPFHNMEECFPPSDFAMLVGLSYQRMNRLREERFLEAKEKGYSLVSYVSSKAVTWPDLSIGENCVLAEQTVVHPYVSIGNDVTIGSNAVIGHHSVIKDHVFISPGVVILGGVTIEPNCIIAANATVREGIRIARECLIGMGVVIHRNTKERQAYVAGRPELLPKPTNDLSEWLSWSVDAPSSE
jgi:sugar O-acyltransferase (sialic acid O-acetyltransferase NeuD family)